MCAPEYCPLAVAMGSASCVLLFHSAYMRYLSYPPQHWPSDSLPRRTSVSAMARLIDSESAFAA
eukprot:5799261-Amphidinium_carterae.1